MHPVRGLRSGLPAVVVLRALGDLLERSSGTDRARPAGIRRAVALRGRRPGPPAGPVPRRAGLLPRLDEQPGLGVGAVTASVETRQRVLAVQLGPVQPEGRVPALDGLRERNGAAPAVVAERPVGALVPDDDGAAAVLALRDDPSNSRYSSGWSSVGTASRLSFGSADGPFGTAQDLSTPSTSSLKSKCIRRASWICTTKQGASPCPGVPPRGSDVVPKSRLPRYFSRGSSPLMSGAFLAFIRRGRPTARPVRLWPGPVGRAGARCPPVTCPPRPPRRTGPPPRRRPSARHRCRTR